MQAHVSAFCSNRNVKDVISRKAIATSSLLQPSEILVIAERDQCVDRRAYSYMAILGGR